MQKSLRTYWRCDMESLKFRWPWWLAALIGAILPLSQLLSWISENPANIVWFWDQSTQTPAARTVMADILWAAFVFSLFVMGQCIRTKNYRLLWSVVLTWTIGLSCGFPLYFALQHNNQDKAT